MRLLLPVLCFCLLAACAFSEPASTTAAPYDPVELVRRVETQYQGKSSHGIMRMTIKTSRWSRTLEMESWSEGRDKFLTRILAPAKEKGTCTLKVADNIWNYLPGIDRLMKIPSSLMGESWMGSHLTNDDLVKDNRIDELYSLVISAYATGSAEITGTPKPDAAVVWGKIVYRIDLQKMVPVSIDFFDEEGEKVRTMSFSEVRELDGRWLPFVFRVTPLEKPEEFTEMAYQKIDFSFIPAPDLFSLKSLRNR